MDTDPEVDYRLRKRKRKKFVIESRIIKSMFTFPWMRKWRYHGRYETEKDRDKALECLSKKTDWREFRKKKEL